MKNVILLICSILFVFLLLNQLYINTYDGSTFSNSRSRSIKDGYFLSDYRPNKDSIQLQNRKIKSPNLWVEKGQEASHFLIFFPKKKVMPNSYNIIADSTKKCDSKEYLLDLEDSYQILNCIGGLGFIHKVSFLSDTIKVKIKQGSPALGWQKEIVIDSIFYIKKNLFPIIRKSEILINCEN